MKQFYEGQPDGYQESIEKGLRAVHGFQRYVGGSLLSFGALGSKHMYRR